MENEFDYSGMSVAQKLLLAQELLDSVFDAVTPGPHLLADLPAWEGARSAA